MMLHKVCLPVVYILLQLSTGYAVAAGLSDPFDTDAMVPHNLGLQPIGGAENPCSAPVPGGPIDLLEVVNLALCNNPQTRVAWANSRAQAAQVGVNKTGYLPNAALDASADHYLSGNIAGANQRSTSLTLSYLLYDFGARAASLENARQLLAATLATQDSTVQTVFLGAVQAFYEAQATFSALDAAIESERAAQESYGAAEARYHAGAATLADKLQAQTAYSQAVLNRITTEGNQKNAQGTLANMLGLDANYNITLVRAKAVVIPENFEGDINTLIEQAREHRPDLQAAAAQLKAAQASVDATRAEDLPTLSLSASANQVNGSGFETRNSLIGINLNVPLFSGFAPTYRIRSAEAQVDAKSGQLEQIRLQVALDVWTAYQHLNTATQSLRTSTDLLDSAEQSDRVALGRYKAGVGSILDVLNAQSALATARQQRIQSTLDWNISRATLAEAMGTLDAGLLQTLSDQGVQPSANNRNQKN